MLTGDLRNQIDKLSDSFWSGGVSNPPDVLKRLANRETTQKERPRTDKSFTVPKAHIAAKGYDLSLHRYKEVQHGVVKHRDPQDILKDLWILEDEIQAGRKELEAML